MMELLVGAAFCNRDARRETGRGHTSSAGDGADKPSGGADPLPRYCRVVDLVPLVTGYAKIFASAASSAGFVRCASNPARVVLSLFCSRPNPVKFREFLGRSFIDHSKPHPSDAIPLAQLRSA